MKILAPNLRGILWATLLIGLLMFRGQRRDIRVTAISSTALTARSSTVPNRKVIDGTNGKVVDGTQPQGHRRH